MRKNARQVAAALLLAVSLLSCSRSGSTDAAPSQQLPRVRDDHSYDDAPPTVGTTPATVHPAQSAYGDRSSFYVAAADQASDGRSLVVDEVVLIGGYGWIAVHAQVHNGLGPILGHSQRLPAGTSRIVTATLDSPIQASLATVLVMVHRDTDGNESFDYPSADGPASLPDGTSVMVPIRLSIS